MGFGQKNPSGSGAQSAAGDPIRTITGFAADPLLFRGAVADGPVRSGQLGASDCSPVGSGDVYKRQEPTLHAPALNCPQCQKSQCQCEIYILVSPFDPAIKSQVKGQLRKQREPGQTQQIPPGTAGVTEPFSCLLYTSFLYRSCIPAPHPSAI